MGKSKTTKAKEAIDQAQAALQQAEDALTPEAKTAKAEATIEAIVTYDQPETAASDAPVGDDDRPETCESGLKDCGPVEYHDADGVPLCKACWDELEAVEGREPVTPASIAGLSPQPVEHPDARFAAFTVADALTYLGVDAQFPSSHPIHRTMIAAVYHPDGTCTIGAYVERKPERFNRDTAAARALSEALRLDAPRHDIGG